MKDTLKKIFRPFVKNDLAWKALKPLSSLGNFMQYERKLEENKASFAHLFKDLRVQNGPFKGLQYPSLSAVGSALYPKLIGSYEQEIHNEVNELCDTDYVEVVNIGCAEGYYAVGMARRMPNTKIYAYDISEKARNLCQQMATLNGVGGRVLIGGEYTASDLAKRKFEGKALIVCDCEGAEKDILTSENMGNLKDCDFLIETHDCIDITISTYLQNLLKDTHDLQWVKSNDDIEKAKTYNYKGTENLSLTDKWRLYGEGRVAIMEWIIARPKK
ncbi:MAG: hypothetical protein AB8B69_16655 [Chitinophagales bacterium]